MKRKRVPPKWLSLDHILTARRNASRGTKRFQRTPRPKRRQR